VHWPLNQERTGLSICFTSGHVAAPPPCCRSVVDLQSCWAACLAARTGGAVLLLLLLLLLERGRRTTAPPRPLPSALLAPPRPPPPSSLFLRRRPERRLLESSPSESIRPSARWLPACWPSACSCELPKEAATGCSAYFSVPRVPTPHRNHHVFVHRIKPGVRLVVSPFQAATRAGGHLLRCAWLRRAGD
jgi:hypothetical protein